MSIKVYSVSGAPRAWRVLLGLAIKGLEYEIITLQISQGELKTPEFLAMNPRATVPVLMDGDYINTDSIGSLAWLDRAYPNSPLFGSNAKQAGKIWQRVTDANDYLRNATDACLLPILVNKKGLPEASSVERLKWVEACRNFKAELSLLEQALDQSEYICGDQPSAVEAICYPELRILQRAMETKQELMTAIGFGDLSEFPKLVAWIERVGALSGVSHTQPPHWKG